jgi:hypothetical protein
MKEVHVAHQTDAADEGVGTKIPPHPLVGFSKAATPPVQTSSDAAMLAAGNQEQC